jgi:diguanylate cyclase (GGDEF)-like protein
MHETSQSSIGGASTGMSPERTAGDGAPFIDAQVGTFLFSHGFSLLDMQGDRTMPSDRMREIGMGLDGFSPDFISNAVHPQDRQGLEMALSRLLSGAESLEEGHFRFSGRDGRNWCLALSLKAFERNPDGSLRSLMVHDEDITQLVSTREEVHQKLAEIESLKRLLISINRSLDLNETLNLVIEHLHQMIPFDGATIQAIRDRHMEIIGSFGFSGKSVQRLTFPVDSPDTPAGRVFSSLRPVICNDVMTEFAGFIQFDPAMPMKSWLGIPLVHQGNVLGLLALYSLSTGIYAEQHIRIASSVSDHLAVAIEHAFLHTAVKIEARTDKLTGLANRHALEHAGQELFSKALREDLSLGILMIDIDNFKIVNDKYGHEQGDKVLTTIATVIQQSLRSRDLPVRYGGEEFLVLLPGATTREALVVAERLRTRVSDAIVEGIGSCPTVSIGVFSGIPNAGESLHDFIDKADDGMYEAKRAGRNRFRVWSPKPSNGATGLQD